MLERSVSDQELEALYQQEEAYIGDIPPAATPAEFAWGYLGIPENVHGLTVVDLGSGGSPLIQRLLEGGANGHGVDALYNRTDEEIAQILRQTGDILVNQAEYGHQRKFRDMMNGAEVEFWKSYAQYRTQRYHAGFLTRVPLPADAADLTLSFNSISNLPDYDVMMLAMEEAIRITKPGGKIIIAPFDVLDTQYWLYAQEHADMLERLTQHPLVAKTHVETDIHIASSFPMPDMNRLTIVKAA